MKCKYLMPALWAMFGMSLVCQSPLSAQPATVADGSELSWPRVYTNGVVLAIYQPQIEKWEGETLESRSAVAITPVGGNAPVYGVAWLRARTAIDKSAGIVTLDDIMVVKVKFPTATQKESEYLALIRSHVPTMVRNMALDHLEGSYAISEAVRKARAVPVKNEPPRVIYATSPSLLVLVDGQPVFRPLASVPDVRQVINTRALILENGGKYYLFAANHWYQASQFEGPWSAAMTVPGPLAAAKEAAVAADNVDLLQPGENAVAGIPAVYVSTVPTELVESDGPVQFVPIEGTDLMEVKNSDGALFMNVTDQRYYLLASGRWFKAPTLQGPWVFVPYKDLPADFARIPSDHPRANVLVSVPGTAQAEEAVIANSIPQSATINRHEATVQTTYDGPPQFQPIQGTPLSYAVNSATPVVEFNPTTYYCVENGVWFVARTPNGPWAVATSVPASIYSIPPSCPIHYVTYVRVYNATPDYVDVGYTPGYFGTIECPDDVVVYGSGWYYPPYIGSYWIGWPWTYGFGAGFACNWDLGFGFGFAAGYPLGIWWNPWWGPFHWGWHHHWHYPFLSINHFSAYDHWGRGVVREQHSFSHNSWDGHGWSRNWATRFNPYSSRTPSRETPGQYHPYNGNFAGRAEINHGAEMLMRRPASRQNALHAPAMDSRNNLYGDRQGNVYRYNVPSQRWEQNRGATWQRAPANRAGQLNREAYGRSIGQQRFQTQRSFGGGFGRSSGGRVGGGGRR